MTVLLKARKAVVLRAFRSTEEIRYDEWLLYRLTTARKSFTIIIYSLTSPTATLRPLFACAKVYVPVPAIQFLETMSSAPLRAQIT